MDERKGRRKLDQLGLPKVGTVGILFRAKGEGLIESLRAELEKLQRTSFRLDPSILEEALQQVGEL